MKIVRETINIKYGELEAGDVFTYCDDVFIKTADDTAVRLGKGYFTEQFDDEDYVRKVAAELRIS